MKWNEPIDVELGKAYGVFTDTGDIYEVNLGIYEDWDFADGCTSYTLFGEERCDFIPYLQEAEVIIYTDFAGKTVTVAKMDADFYDIERGRGFKIVAYFDDKRYEFEDAAELEKAWIEYRRKKVEPLLNLDNALNFIKHNLCCLDDWPIYPSKELAMSASSSHKLFLAQLKTVADETGEDYHGLLYKFGLT